MGAEERVPGIAYTWGDIHIVERDGKGRGVVITVHTQMLTMFTRHILFTTVTVSSKFLKKHLLNRVASYLLFMHHSLFCLTFYREETYTQCLTTGQTVELKI